ncbi:hypothetical protein AB0M19_36220 [Streptomyces sp. NPDC051920]|uniref:hypothetical protein n=1 Tax=Streptomyces sp. NPDC051920 TaxID=3155523 RepID=UPI00342C8862
MGEAFDAATPLHWTPSGLLLGIVSAALAVAGVRGRAHQEPYAWTRPLRRLHSGRIGDYVVWFLAGITLLSALALPGVLAG